MIKNNGHSNNSNKTTKNIRQEYAELKSTYDGLAEAHLILQRTLKLILLTEQFETLYYGEKIARYYTERELDAMRIEVKEDKDNRRIEIKLAEE